MVLAVRWVCGTEFWASEVAHNRGSLLLGSDLCCLTLQRGADGGDSTSLADYAAAGLCLQRFGLEMTVGPGRS
ncbi:hypothetical protein NDU88_005343 [Pleurodeles waltl]|uniref:Uncharacterized protein n=1 Tax=Pleurodeles waltl TaxID=8319 RepID=A0AAV7W7J8_PLEWA|nr:hypothetical protein NDU88_005343 [Pleurodeles waltl]